MSYNGSGTFNINTAGQPVVTGTVISSTAFNALTADLATGLSTAITKDGQTAATARIPFAQGISSTLVTDSTSTTTGSIITAGGAGVAKALFVGTTANVAGAVTLQSTLAVGGVATYSAQPIFSSLTASSAVATDASKGLVSVTNTGTGNNVLATSPTITTPTISGDASISGLTVGKGANAVASNTAFGISALAANQAGGTNNTAIGNAALDANTTGDANTAVGDEALGANTTANNNTAVGYKAGTTFNGSGDTYHTFVGASAGRSTTTGDYNTALGGLALYSTTTGSNNTAVGMQALQANTTASSNTAVGYQAGYTNVTGVGNTFIGDKAGYTSNGTGNAYNTCVGQSAGYGLTTGVSNTFIGVSATASASGALVTTGSKNTILGPYSGNQGSLDIRTASNYIVLSDGDGNPRGFFNDTGYLKVAPSAGDLNGITGGYHEIVTASAGSNALRLRQANASFNDTIFRVASNRNTTNNTYYFMDCLDSGGTAKFRVADSGNVTNTNNSYGSISDAKLKENITDATPKLDKLNQVRVVNYNLIGDEKKQLGVIAQELEQIFPSIVDETADRDEEGNDLGTTTKSVKYSVFVPMLIKAIQEQQALITSLTTRITALEQA